MHRFFVEDVQAGVIDDQKQVKQLSSVLRVAVGDRCVVFDNSGLEWTIEVTSVHSRKIQYELLEKRQGIGFDREVTLYMGLLKKDKFEWVVQKATELGVSHIVPVITQRCVKNDISQHQYDRYRMIMKEATEQSGGAVIPFLDEALSFTQALDSLDKNNLNLIAYEGKGGGLLPFSAQATQPLSLFIGPEGGFTSEEIQQAQDVGVEVVTFGRRILRAETAAIAALGRLLIV